MTSGCFVCVRADAAAPGSRVGVDGPFRHLEGVWRFVPLADDACTIEFKLHYEFSSHLLEKIIAPVFSHIANTFVDAFVTRADILYAAK